MTSEPTIEEGAPVSKPWFKKKRFVIPIGFLVLAMMSGVFSSSSETTSSPASSSATSSESAAPEEPVEVEPVGGRYGNYPEAQLKFVQTIEKAKSTISDAETDLQESVALRSRDKALCAILGNNKATNWTGVIGRVGANGEGKAHVLIDFADDMKVSTWNNALSDFQDNTLIPTPSSFFDDLVALKKGDQVTFSGTFLSSNDSCLSKKNLTDFFYGRDPDFLFRFSDISAR
jgi:hypothetical protein